MKSKKSRTQAKRKLAFAIIGASLGAGMAPLVSKAADINVQSPAAPNSNASKGAAQPAAISSTKPASPKPVPVKTMSWAHDDEAPKRALQQPGNPKNK